MVGEVELVAGSTGRFTARQPVTVLTYELAWFRDELASLLDAQTGEATLAHMEEEFGAKVAWERGTGELEAFVVDPIGPELRVEGVRTDRTYLAGTLRELNAAVAAFGVRGNPYG